MNFAVWLPLTLVGLAVTAATLVHLATHEVSYMPKWAWTLLIIFTFPVGPIVYFAVYTGSHTQLPDAEGRRAP